MHRFLILGLVLAPTFAAADRDKAEDGIILFEETETIFMDRKEPEGDSKEEAVEPRSPRGPVKGGIILHEETETI